jgi:hypothetical protein
VRRADEMLVKLTLQIAAIGRNGRPQRWPPWIRAALLSLNETTKMAKAHAR